MKAKEKTVGRRRKAHGKAWMSGGAALVLFLVIILIGTSQGALPNFSAADEPLAAAEDGQSGTGQNADAADAGGPWYLTLVNRENPIPQNYRVNLVEVVGGEQVDERIYESLMEMLEAAKEGNQGQLLRVVSGYRTKEKQRRLYHDKVAQYRGQGYTEGEAKDMAQQWVSVPGHSEHQLGFAVDINGATYDVYLWLQENSYKYGFIFRYPGDKTEITGAAEEVWHYRYVGVEAATEIYEQGLCLEEYLENSAQGI